MILKDIINNYPNSEINIYNEWYEVFLRLENSNYKVTWLKTRVEKEVFYILNHFAYGYTKNKMN